MKRLQKKVARKTARKKYKLVVIGTSAGGLQALVRLVRQLAADFPLPVLIVQHVSADATGRVLVNELNKAGSLSCKHARNGAALKAGNLYVAPSGNHLMLKNKKHVLVTKGAHENRSRPAIDPLFRSAAVTFRNEVIAILLTGYLDDGSAGMNAIKRCGGTCIIQDPADAQYPDMPRNALNQVVPDYCIPISEMGAVLSQLLTKRLGKPKPIPEDILIEAEIAKRVLSDLPSVKALGFQVPFNCPGCGGVLWKVDMGNGMRYRCHTGHAYTAAALLAEQNKRIEETLWTALRMFEERKNLLTTIAKDQTGKSSRTAAERAKASDIHIQRIRMLLKSDTKGTSDDMPV